MSDIQPPAWGVMARALGGRGRLMPRCYPTFDAALGAAECMAVGYAEAVEGWATAGGGVLAIAESEQVLALFDPIPVTADGMPLVVADQNGDPR